MTYALQNRRGESCCVKDFCTITARNRGALVLMCIGNLQELCVLCEKIGMAIANCQRDGKVDGRVVFKEMEWEVAVSAF